MKQYILIFIKISLVVILIGFLALVLWPSPSLTVPKLDNLNYDQAITKVLEIKSKDTNQINPDCQNILLPQPQKAARSIVIYHGLTNCSKQFGALGQLMYEKGYSVYIPRIPYHGYRDGMTNDFERLKSFELVQTMQNSMSIAKGLGEQVDVMGISGGGNLALWSGQNYQANQVLAIAPMFAASGYSSWHIPIIHNYFSLVSNENKWWDDKIQNNSTNGPLHAYPRYSTKAVVAFLQVSLDFRNNMKSKAGDTKYKLLTLEGDKAVGNETTQEYFDELDKHNATKSNRIQIPTYHNLNHDVIDPMQIQAKTDLVYPIILELLER